MSIYMHVAVAKQVQTGLCTRKPQQCMSEVVALVQYIQIRRAPINVSLFYRILKDKLLSMLHASTDTQL